VASRGFCDTMFATTVQTSQQFFLANYLYRSDTDVVIPVYRIGEARALVTLRVFLRLTAMDVCCGPPTSR
jgi:hypothetical protein